MDAVALRVFMGAAGAEPLFGYSVLGFQINGVAINGDDVVIVGQSTTTPGRIAVTRDLGASWYSFDNLSALTTDLNAVCYGDGKWVAVGVNSIAVSSDLQTWTITPFASKTFNAVTYGLDQFIAVGNGGIIYTSPDAITWTQQTSGTVTALTGVAASPTKIIVSVGSGGGVYTSTDGVSWTSVATGSTATQNTIGYGNGVFVTGPVYSSDDGVTWAATSGLFSPQVYSIVWDGTYYIAAALPGTSYIYRSLNGISWTNASGAFVATGATIGNALASSGGVTIVIANSSFVFSTNNSLATQVQNIGPVPSSHSGGAVGALYWDGINYTAISRYGYLATSTNGRDWVLGDPKFVVEFNYFVSAKAISRLTGSTYCALGTGGSSSVGEVATSADGVTWTARTLGATTEMNDLGSSGSLFVAVGGNFGGAGVIRTSPDGITWTARTSNSTSALNAVVYAAATFVAVGLDGKIVTSTNGTTWTARTSGTANNFNDVTYGAGVFLAVGNNGLVYTSPNGTTWTDRTISTTDDFACVSWNGAVFVASGTTGTYTSSNGIVWKKVFVYGGSVVASSGAYQTVVGGPNASILMSPRPPSPPYPS